jgi:catechol 2,3-dioxygenase-like lactoylglutathione lyase family enzyme
MTAIAPQEPAMPNTDAHRPTYHWQFDHINLRTTGNPAVQTLFGQIMGLHPGYRPPFPFPGEWLYRDGDAWLHLVQGDAPQDTQVQLGHIAFRTDEPASSLLTRLRASGLRHDFLHVPQENSAQIFVQLPGGLVVELDAPLDAAAGAPLDWTTDRKDPIA